VLSEWYFGDGLPTWALMAEIVLAGVVVVLSGSRLTLLADKVADKYNLGGAWIGLVLLATVTSLPEVVTGCTAVWVDQPNMAFAAIFGSCSFNIVLIVLFNFFVGGGSILRGKGRSHALSSSFGIVMLSLALLGILAAEKFSQHVAVAQALEITVALLIVMTYVLCMKMIYRTEMETNGAQEEHDDTSDSAHSGLLPRVIGVSAVLVMGAWWLARTGDVLSDHPIEMIGRPLGATFVGSLFLAIATSLPEIVTGLAAVKLGNLDMALGNIFGSNMFNIFVIPMLKATSLLSGRSLLMAGDRFNAQQGMISGLLPILLTAVVVGSISYRSRRTVLKRFGVDSALIATIYVAGMIVLLAG